MTLDEHVEASEKHHWGETYPPYIDLCETYPPYIDLCEPDFSCDVCTRARLTYSERHLFDFFGRPGQ